MQVLHDTSDKEKKPMKIVPEGETEKMEELNAEEAIETMEAIDPEETIDACLLYTSPSPRDGLLSRMPSSA